MWSQFPNWGTRCPSNVGALCWKGQIQCSSTQRALRHVNSEWLHVLRASAIFLVLAIEAVVLSIGSNDSMLAPLIKGFFLVLLLLFVGTLSLGVLHNRAGQNGTVQDHHE